jgi:hypothetical protein
MSESPSCETRLLDALVTIKELEAKNASLRAFLKGLEAPDWELDRIEQTTPEKAKWLGERFMYHVAKLAEEVFSNGSAS